MDQNKRNKIKEFFKKEGFYVVLFVCLCVVAVVATVATRSNTQAVDEKKTEFSLDIQKDDSTSTSNTNDKDSEENKTEDKKIEESKTSNNEEEEEATQTSAKVTTQMYPFVDGVVSNSLDNPITLSDNEHITSHEFIFIRANENAEVKAAGEGKITKVSQSADRGAFIEIQHQGIITEYANLNPETINVKIGDTVNNSTVLAKVGSSAKLYSNTEFKNDLMFSFKPEWSGYVAKDPTEGAFTYLKADK